MKQPENELDIYCEGGSWWVDVTDLESKYATIAQGRTRASAIKAARRRLGRLLRDLGRIEKGGKR